MGKVRYSFASNYDLSQYLHKNHRPTWRAKQADDDPRGDLYRPKHHLRGDDVWDVGNFHEPPGHTRSVETYKDGTPKWWKDIRYRNHQTGVHPSVFIFFPALLWSKPRAWIDRNLGRSGIKLTRREFLSSLRDVPT